MTVTEAFDEKNCLAETQYGTGTLETQLLCFEGENNKEHAIGFAPSSDPETGSRLRQKR